jgi:hypothetical protein
MATNPEISQHYPKKIALDETLVQTGPQFLRLKPGGSPQIRQVSLRLMGTGDKARVLEFAHGLPEEDLLFLRSDIGDPATVDDWIKDLQWGTTVTLLAEPDGLLARVRQPPCKSAPMDAQGRRDQHAHRTGLAIARPRRGSLHGEHGAGRHAAA